MTATDLDKAVIAEVIAAEDERCRMISTANLAAVESFISDDFTYTHISGEMEDKAAWMATLAIRPHTCLRDNLEVRLYGNREVAVMTGGLIRLRNAEEHGSTSKMVFNALQVWAKRDGRWQLVAQQGAKTEDSRWSSDPAHT